MRVWLTDKTSFGDELARVLGNPVRIQGVNRGWDTDGGRVLFASGHLIQLAEPQDYDPKYAQWDIADLPIIPDRWRLREIDEKRPWLDDIRKGIHGATEIVVATDAGREGEYVAWLVMNHLRLHGVPRLRLWSSGANAAAIAKAISNLSPYSERVMLAEAAQIRAESDWIEGMNLSRLFTKRFAPENHREPISIGRVQTAALAIIVRRHREVRDFKPQDYREFEIRVTSGIHTVVMHHRPPEDARVTDQKTALDMSRGFNGKQAPIVVESQDAREAPPRLFDSASLQIRAYNLWGWPAERTEGVAQALYDRHKLVTYPKTDGTHLEDGQREDVATILANVRATSGFSTISLRDGTKFADLGRMAPSQQVIRPDVFSSQKLAASGADHPGIAPTVERADLSLLDDDEARLYALIVRQYVAQLMPDCRYQQRRMRWVVDGVEFTAAGRSIQEPGWRVLYDPIDDAATRAEAGSEVEEENPKLAMVPNGAMGLGSYPRVITRTTRAPAPYTEGSIIAIMRNLAPLATDERTRAILSAARSIGTKSTWGDIVRKLKDRQYITSNGGRLAPTVLGEDIITFCETHVPKIVSIETTATLEAMLIEVERSTVEPDKARTYLQTRNIQAIRLCLAAPDTKLRAPPRDKSRPQQFAPFVDFPQGSWEVEIQRNAEDDRLAVKALGARFNGETKKWHVPRSPEAETAMRERGWLK